MGKEKSPTIHRIKVEFEGIVIEEFDSEHFLFFGSPESELFLAFRSDAFYYRMMEIARAMVALREVIDAAEIKFDKDDHKSWREIGIDRPDLVEKARLLMNSTGFQVTYWSEITTIAAKYATVVAPKRVKRAFESCLEMIIIQTLESAFEAKRLTTGRTPRSAKKRQAALVRTARKLAASLGDMPARGRKQGSRLKSVPFNYAKLCQEICNASMAEGATQFFVAKRLGFRGANADDQLRVALRRRVPELKQHGHKGHRWKDLCKKVLENHMN